MHPDPAGSPTAPAPFVCDPVLLRLAVRARQKALRLSQQEIAGQAGLSEPTLSRFMSGQDPSDQTVNRLVHWLELELDRKSVV